MPSLCRVVTIALKLAALTACTMPAFASPIAMPLPLNNVVSARPRAFASSSVRSSSSVPFRPSPKTIASPPGVETSQEHSIGPRKMKGTSNVYTKAKQHGEDARKHANNYKRYAAQSSSVSGDDKDFQRRCAAELSGYHTSLLGLQESLAYIGREKGLANYDRDNDLQTLLKDLVNCHKNVLSATTVLVYNVPGLGGILGPIVYEIKCIVDLLLDAVENISDALLNSLGLSVSLGQTAKTACLLGFGSC